MPNIKFTEKNKYIIDFFEEEKQYKKLEKERLNLEKTNSKEKETESTDLKITRCSIKVDIK